jgi:hypothetical protein
MCRRLLCDGADCNIAGAAAQLHTGSGRKTFSSNCDIRRQITPYQMRAAKLNSLINPDSKGPRTYERRRGHNSGQADAAWIMSARSICMLGGLYHGRLENVQEKGGGVP